MLSGQKKSADSLLRAPLYIRSLCGFLSKKSAIWFGFDVNLAGYPEGKDEIYNSSTKLLLDKQIADASSGSEKWLA